MEKYRTMNDGYIQRQSDLALIPPTTKNKDYVQYLKDKDSGAEILPFDYAAEEIRQITEKEKLKEEEEKEKLIQKKIRELAITALETEGKLDKSGKIIKQSN